MEGWPKAVRTIEELYNSPFRSPATWHKHRQAIEILSRAEPNPSDVSVGTISRIARTLLDRGLRPATVNSLLKTIRAECAILASAGIMRANPFAGRRLFVRESVDDRIDRHLSQSEVLAILAQADHEYREAALACVGDAPTLQTRWRAARLRAVAYLVSHTALRKLEAMRLRWEHVDVSGTRVRVSDIDGRTKTLSSVGFVPLPIQACHALIDWRSESEYRSGRSRYVFRGWTQDKPWTQGTSLYRPTGQVQALGERAGVSGVTLLSLRHSWATRARHIGLGPAEIRDVMRHTSERTQRHYLHEDNEQQRSIAERFTW